MKGFRTKCQVPGVAVGYNRRCQVVQEDLTLDTGKHDTEKGQALAETAIFSAMAVLLAFGLLTLIPVHRAHTAATSAAYGCAQFVSQSPNPNWAVWQAEQVARQTLEETWSGTPGVEYDVQVLAPSGPGSQGGCAVSYRPTVLFNGLLELPDPGWRTITFLSQSEAWKARWR